MKNLVPILIGIIIGVVGTYLYLAPQDTGPISPEIAELPYPEEQKALDLKRKNFGDSLRKNDRILERSRGERMSSGQVKKMIKDYTTLRDLLNGTTPTTGVYLGAGVGFGLDKLQTLIDDIKLENTAISQRHPPTDSLEITGIRAHFALKSGVMRGNSIDHLDIVLTPCTIKGVSVFDWKYLKSEKDTAPKPPPMDSSNPCPDVCP